MSLSYTPRARLGLLGFIGRLLCWITGILLLGVPYKYWLYAASLEHFTPRAFTVPMVGLLLAHLLLAVIFLVPSMTEKYLRSRDSFARKLGVRVLTLATILLLGLDAMLFLYKQNVELPGFLARITPQQWIMALTAWMMPYFGLLVLPGAYLRELNVRYELRRLRLPIKTGVWILNGKGYFYPIGAEAKRAIAAFSAQTGLPLGKAKKSAPEGLLMLLLALPLFPVLVGVAPALKRGSFLPNADLLQLTSEWAPYVAGYVFLLMALRAYMAKSAKLAIGAVVAPPVVALMLWPLSALHGMPILYAIFSQQGPEIEREFTVLAQPDKLTAMFDSACLSPLLAQDSAGSTVYLCGLRFLARNGVQDGVKISLHGWETDFGFYHEREITVRP